MKEVEMMQRTDVQVRAYAADDEADSWTVECTECGPLGLCSDAAVDDFAVSHMTSTHGAEVVTS